MNHRVGSVVFGLAVGLAIAVGSYQWVTDPDKRVAHEEQEKVVALSREILKRTIAIQDLELVDPLAPQRKVGKVYIYPLENGWELSGYYRRDGDDRWHPFLMALSSDLSLLSLKVQDSDPGLAQIAAANPLVDVRR
jgi:hypothetical protein